MANIMEIIRIAHEPVEYIGRSNIGMNLYKYRWYVYVKDDRKRSIGNSIYIKGKWVNVKRIFRGTKPEVKKWLKIEGLTYKW